MKTASEIHSELHSLLSTANECIHNNGIHHREGRIRSLVWVLTGIDPGYQCLGDTARLMGMLEPLGWNWHRFGDQVVFTSPFDD